MKKACTVYIRRIGCLRLHDHRRSISIAGVVDHLVNIETTESSEELLTLQMNENRVTFGKETASERPRTLYFFGLFSACLAVILVA